MQAQTIHKGPPAQPPVLPPLQNLPSWSRSSLERRRQPRPIVRDQQQSLLHEEIDIDNRLDGRKQTLSPLMNEPRIVSAPSRTGEKDLRQKVADMEKSLDFVQNEHAQVLKNLHEEIERLKTENKDLNFKLVMSRSGVNVEEISPVPSEEIDKLPQSQHRLSNENPSIAKKDKQSKSTKSASGNPDKVQKHTTEPRQNSRNSSASAKKRNPSGSKSAASPKSAKNPAPSSEGSANKSKFLSKARAKQLEKEQAALAESPVPTPLSPVWSSIHGGQQMIMVTLTKDNIIQVHVPNETGPRSPTLSECKTIIAEQQETNHRQSRELLKLRTDLRDAKLILAKKLNQTTYPGVKASNKVEADLSNLSASNVHSNRHLPQLPYREPVNSGRLPARPAANNSEKFTLPSLRPNINTGVADRRRRQQAILRGRAARPNFY